MPPVDSTPNCAVKSNFELLYSLKGYDKIPIHEYVSKQTGLTVVIAEVDGPVVNGFFCLVTEAFDDDGLPHTLEHLVFLGSEDYPYKGMLDMLANRCLASGTNAWTDIDHTCYTMETAGSEGFLSLMPIFIEHILFPVLTEEAFVTEVHHITGEGTDAGVVYCEMQGRENSAESRLHLTMARKIYPGHCGYSSETGGIMKNLRESTNNTKVRNYHKEFYRPENLKIIITGQVKPEEVFKALEKLELKIMAKGDRGPFQRPWQSPVPPLTESSQDLVIKYPTDEENNGVFTIAWRGPSCVNELYEVTACSLLLKYLTEYSVSPLPKAFVEIEDPFASKIAYNLYENSISCLYVLFQNVPVAKLPTVRSKLLEVLTKILEEKAIDMAKLGSIINRYRLESLSNLENSPHQTVAFMVIGHMLYGNTKSDLEQRINPLQDLIKLSKEPLEFWLKLLRKYFIDNTYVAIQCYPSKEEKQKLAEEEKLRVEKQRQTLGEAGLKEQEEILEKAIEANEKEPPAEMLMSIPIPSLSSISFHTITRFSSKNCDKSRIDLSKTPVFTYFDHLNTNFVYIFGLLDTSKVPTNLRVYLPLLLESLVELPIQKDGKIIPYEEVVAKLNDDTVSCVTSVGLEHCGLFKCGSYSETVALFIQVESAKYRLGLQWLTDLLYNTQIVASRLKVMATKMINSVANAKRNGFGIMSYASKELCFAKESNIHQNSLLLQQKFLTELVKKLDTEECQDVLKDLELLKKTITDPSNFVLYIAGNLDTLENPAKPLEEILPGELSTGQQLSRLNSIPDWKFLTKDCSLSGCLIGLGCLESSSFCQSVKSITCHEDPDLPALMLYIQYLIQAEGPMWRQIRGKGYSYGYRMSIKVDEGLLYLVLTKASNVVEAYREAKEIIKKQLETKEWDNTQLDAAKSSLVFKIIDEENTIGSVVGLSLSSYFQGVDYTYNRKLLGKIPNIKVEDLNRVGDMYIKPLLNSTQVRTAVVTDPSKIEEMAEAFKKLDLNLTVYPSLEESFLAQ